MASLQLKVPPPLVVFAAAALMAGIACAFPGWAIQLPAHRPLALALAVLGLACVAAGISQFRRHQTTLDPRQPQRASSLVDTGIYRVTRNPMYLGFLVVLTGWAVHLEHLLAFLVLPLYMLYLGRYQIGPEERFLAAKFGDQYQAYRRRVRRWL